MKKSIFLFFVLFTSISFANPNNSKIKLKTSTENAKNTKVKNISTSSSKEQRPSNKIKKTIQRPQLCSWHQYITCTNSMGEVIVIGSIDHVYWCDSGVHHHTTLIEMPEFEELCYL